MGYVGGSLPTLIFEGIFVKVSVPRGFLRLFSAASVFVFVASMCLRVQAQTVSLAAPADTFSYSGDKGPAFWAATYPDCAESKQSPIDLPTSAGIGRKLQPLDLDLRDSTYVLNNPGYTVTSAPDREQTLFLDGVKYKLLQFHFHTLSEHTVDAQQGAMELHAVFRNDEGHLAVIGQIYKTGKPNHFLHAILAVGLPEKMASPDKVVPSLDLAQAFVDTSRYFTYRGSLTTPPCHEQVRWIVLKDWAELSPEQLHAFRDVLGNDFRPLQKKNGRVVLQTGW